MDRFKASISTKIRIQETCRDALRFHWIKDSDPQKNSNIPIRNIGVWTYTIAVCTRRHSSTSLPELYQQT